MLNHQQDDNLHKRLFPDSEFLYKDQISYTTYNHEWILVPLHKHPQTTFYHHKLLVITLNDNAYGLHKNLDIVKGQESGYDFRQLNQ
jgi:uncharacterized protein YhbP (UPF0306 family)